MNLYLVEIADDTLLNWDGYDSWVVAAETEKSAFEGCIWADTNVKGIADVKISLIGTSTSDVPGAILGSFNAG
jgi:hypothetical protein